MLTPGEKLRYSRHLLLPEVGKNGQEKLKASSVLIVGMGGLGTPAAMYLAAAGVGRIGLVDGDAVSVSNLQRQVLYATEDTGRLKVDAASQRLKALNPYVEIIAYPAYLTTENAISIARNWDLVVDGTDRFPTRYLINDVCKKLSKPFVHGSVYRYEGQVVMLGKEKGPCYRCLFPTPPPAELTPSCAEAGVLGVVPGHVGVLQANIVLQHFLGFSTDENPELARIVMSDLRTMETRTMWLPVDADCPVCSKDPGDVELVDYETFCGTVPSTHVPSVSVFHLRDALRLGGHVLILDVRTEAEYALGNLGGDNIPVSEINRFIPREPPGETLIICRTGRRSAIAAQTLLDAGFTRVYNVSGGLEAWRKEIDPTFPI